MKQLALVLAALALIPTSVRAAEPTPVPVATVAPTPQPSAAPLRGLVNRSILTVERRIYSFFDVELLLHFWNLAAPEARVETSTQWATVGGFFFDQKKSLLRNSEKWPADVRRLLFITLSWPELSRLVAFASSDEARSELVDMARGDISRGNLSDTTRAYLQSAPREALLELADMVLRARQSERTRGGLRENYGGLLWYWHQRTTEEKPKP